MYRNEKIVSRPALPVQLPQAHTRAASPSLGDQYSLSALILLYEISAARHLLFHGAVVACH
jgi:hypothetical protein